jgi:hypothetical protein
MTLLPSADARQTPSQDPHRSTRRERSLRGDTVSVQSPSRPIDSAMLTGAFLNGIHAVAASAEHLDRINVFPVADGDTGTNLAMTLLAVDARLRQSPPRHAGQLLTRIADASLDGARGNSGAIVANLLQGLADSSGALASLTVENWIAAVSTGAIYARQAVSAPRDGTILSVLDRFAAAQARRYASGVSELAPLLRQSVDEAYEALAATQHELSELRQAGVVDAGAAGLVGFLDAFTRHIETGELRESHVSFDNAPTEPEASTDVATLTHRWCTECLITGPSLDQRRLREDLAALGSSLVIAGSHQKLRVHIHVSDPASAFEVASRHGEVSGQKADDMHRQQVSTQHAARRPVAIVTDSAADLPAEETERLDIHVVPLRLHFGQESFLDRISLSHEDFYQRLAAGTDPPKTSQPPPGDFRRLFDILASHHQSVVSIHLTSRASGTWQSADSAATRAAASARITVVDSLNASAGQALLVLHAAELAASGQDAETITNALARMIPRTKTYACCQTLDYAVRGGRVPGWVLPVVRRLHVSPLLATRPDGRIGLGGVLWGTRRLTEKFAVFLGRRLNPAKRYRLLIAHGAAEKASAQLEAQLRRAHDNIETIWRVPTGAALGVHGGPGFLVVGIQERSDET